MDIGSGSIFGRLITSYEPFVLSYSGNFHLSTYVLIASPFSYLIIIKGLMPNVVASLYHDLTSETTNPPAWTQNGNVWITLFMAVLVPLCFLKHLNSLRHTSYVALFSVGA